MDAETVLGEQIAAAARATEGVVDLSSGPFGTVSTPIPRGRIEGVALRPDSVQVGVVARYGPPLPEIAEAVLAAVRTLAQGREVHVSIEDVETEPAALTEPAAPASHHRVTVEGRGVG